MDTETNFMSDCISGKATIGDVDSYISMWHDSKNENRELHEFLGLTRNEYEIFVKGENSDNYLQLLINKHNR